MNRDHTGRLSWSTSKKCILIGLAIFFLRAVLGIEIFPFSSLVGMAFFIYGLVLHQRGLIKDRIS